MTPDALAALHARCFTRPRPWAAAEFAAVLATGGCFLLTRSHGFLLGRVIADEAELLTIAVDPDARRQGMGRDLCAAFSGSARDLGAVTAFLEVAADNRAAQTLYAACGWHAAGRRKRYYGPDLDGLILRLDLGAAHKDG